MDSSTEIRQAIIRNVIQLIQVLLHVLSDVIQSYIQKDPIPYHTSILSGHQWVMELISGHPKYIQNELGMSREVFLQLVSELCTQGCSDTRNIAVEEQLTIFLYILVTGLTIQHVGEQFQRANDTISRYIN